MTDEAVKTLSIKQISARSIYSLSLLVVVVLGMCVATYVYLTQMSQQQLQRSVANFTITEQLARSGSNLQALAGKITVAGLARDKVAVQESGERISEHLVDMANLMAQLTNLTAESRYEIKKVSSSVTQIYTDLSSGISEIANQLISGASVNSQLTNYSKFNQDMREFNAGLGQLEKWFVKITGLQQRQSQQNQIYYAGAAFIVLLLLLFIYQGVRWNNKLENSLSKLRQAVVQGIQGDFSEIQINSKDSIAETALLFNQMTEKYKDAIVGDAERETTQ